MASTYSNLKIQLMATGENTSTWGNVTNVNLGTAIEEAVTGSASVVFASADQTLTLTDSNASQTARNLRLNITGAAVAGYNLIVPAIAKVYVVNNGSTGTITVKNATGTGIAIPTGKTTWVFNNGTNVVDVVTHLTSLTLASALPIASGGTGGNTAIAARTALSAANSGANTDITSLNPTGSLLLSPTTGTIVGSPTGGVQGAGTINATGLFVNGVAVGVSGGSVSSINASGGSTGMSFSGGPVTTTGTLTLGGTLNTGSGGTGYTSYTNGQLLIGNSGTTLTAATLTAGSGITITNASGGITIAASGGAGTVTSVGGTGTVNGLSLSGTVTTAGNLTLGGTLSGVSLTTQVAGTLSVGNGGTGYTSFTNGQLLIGNGSGLTAATLTAGSGVSITNASGSITIAATGSGGSVTSASVVSSNGFAGTVATATTTPAITLTTTVTGVLKGNGTAISAATAGTDYVAPGGALGTPSSGTLTNCTFPTLNQNTTGSSASCTGNAATATTATTANALNTANGYTVAGLTVNGVINVTGDITAFYTSDKRFKQNIRPINNALTIASFIGGKTFDWTDEYLDANGGEDGYFVRKSDFGVIAQDVEALFPHAIRKREDGTLAVDYAKLVAVAFQAIVELKAEVEALKGAK